MWLANACDQKHVDDTYQLDNNLCCYNCKHSVHEGPIQTSLVFPEALPDRQRRKTKKDAITLCSGRANPAKGIAYLPEDQTTGSTVRLIKVHAIPLRNSRRDNPQPGHPFENRSMLAMCEQRLFRGSPSDKPLLRKDDDQRGG